MEVSNVTYKHADQVKITLYKAMWIQVHPKILLSSFKCLYITYVWSSKVIISKNRYLLYFFENYTKKDFLKPLLLQKWVQENNFFLLLYDN